MSRITQISALTLIAASWLAAVGCSSSNDPSTSTGTGATGNTTSTGATGNVGGSAQGTAGSTVVAQGGGGASSTGTAGSTSIAGSTSSTGGTGSGTAGETGTAGTGTGTAGASTGTGGSGGSFTPLCGGLTTAAGPAPTKAGACTAADPQLCYKTCGPNSVGFKSETCTAGVYAEQSGCSFPSGVDYSCYKIPDAVDASCPTTTPQASQPCSVAACTLCNVGGSYLDSTGATKAGYCVCPAAGASGTSKWSCASTTAWPCPNGQGCE